MEFLAALYPPWRRDWCVCQRVGRTSARDSFSFCTSADKFPLTVYGRGKACQCIYILCDGTFSMYASGSRRRAHGTYQVRFGHFGRSIFSERGVGVRDFIGTLPRVVVLLVGPPAGWEGDRVEHFFLLCFHHLMFTDCMVEGESVAANLYSRWYFWQA